MSRHIGRLSIRQAEFLRALRDNPETMQQVIERYKTKPWILTGWLRRRQFRAALAEAMRDLRARSRVEFDMAYGYAVHLMADILRGGPGNHLIRQTAFDFILLHQLHRRRRGKRGGAAKAAAANPPAPKPADQADNDALIERRVGRKAPPLNPALSEQEQAAIITRLRAHAGLLPPPPDATDAPSA